MRQIGSCKLPVDHHSADCVAAGIAVDDPTLGRCSSYSVLNLSVGSGFGSGSGSGSDSGSDSGFDLDLLVVVPGFGSVLPLDSTRSHSVG